MQLSWLYRFVTCLTFSLWIPGQDGGWVNFCNTDPLVTGVRHYIFAPGSCIGRSHQSDYIYIDKVNSVAIGAGMSAVLKFFGPWTQTLDPDPNQKPSLILDCADYARCTLSLYRIDNTSPDYHRLDPDAIKPCSVSRWLLWRFRAMVHDFAENSSR